MTKIVSNCNFKVKQALDKQDFDKVPLILICIDSLTTNGVHTVKWCNISVYSTVHSFSNIFFNNGDVSYVA